MTRSITTIQKNSLIIKFYSSLQYFLYLVRLPCILLFSKTISYFTFALFLTLFSISINATERSTEKIASIIIDDLGNNLQHGQDVIKIPSALTIAILPKTLYSKQLAKLANKHNKEVMLHLPMQSVTHHQPSPGTLGLHMTHGEFTKQLFLNLKSVPFVRGINNHMGSLLTRHPGHMAWLMDSLSQHGNLYFIDSRTTDKTIAEKIAVEYNIPSLSRDFFLDPDDKESTLQKQFDRFIKKVNERGYALAIAHPYPKTVKFLQQNLKKLKQQGIRLVPASRLIKEAALIEAAIEKSKAIKTANYK